MRGRHAIPNGRGSVTQSIIALPDESWIDHVDVGDCFRAAVASLFDMPLAEVPHFVQLEEEGIGHYYLLFERWCRARGWQPETQPASWLDEHRWPCLVTGYSPRVRHVVVRRQGGELWDPHPSRDGLIKVDGAIAFHRSPA